MTKNSAPPLDIEGVRAYSPSEIDTQSAHDQWEVFLIDEDGFTKRDDEQALAILRLLPEEGDIVAQFGDCILEEIVICRRDAKPVPQYEGSEHLRVPASRQCVDFIEFDLRHIDDPDEALLLWHAAQGAAYALNLGVIQ